MALGVDTCTITNWEKGHCEPKLRFIPAIIEFIQYEPVTSGAQTLGEAIRHYRQLRGISQKELAQSLGIDPSTLAKYEADNNRRRTALAILLEQVVRVESPNIG